MDSAQKQLTYDEPKLLPFDGRARMKRFSKEFLGMTGILAGGDSVMLFSATDDYMGSFESPSHAEIYCAAKGVELSPDVEEITWEGLKKELARRLIYSPAPAVIFPASL